MARKSSVSQERPEVQVAIDNAIREGRATLDEIVAMVREMDSRLSRTAIGRYKKNAVQKFKDFRDAQEMAKIWATKVAEEPDGDVGMLVGQMLRTVAAQATAAMNEATDEDGEATPAKAMDIMLIAKALEHLSKSENAQLARALKIREQAKQEAAATVNQSAKQLGLSDEAVQVIRARILGIKDGSDSPAAKTSARR